MLRAAALYYAIVISLLIGMMSAGLILYTHYYYMETSFYDIHELLIRNAASGLEMLKSPDADAGFKVGKEVDLFQAGSDSVYLKKKIWGIYHVSVSRAHHFPYFVSQTAVNGFEANTEYASIALVLTDHNTPIGYSGKAKITGDARIGKAGYRLNFIEGKAARSGIFISGKASNSDKKLPALNQSMQNQIEAQFANGGRATDDTVIYLDAGLSSYKRAFDQATARIDLPDFYTLSHVHLSGNIKLVGQQHIRLDSSAHLSDVLIICPNVVISKGFSGNVHILSTDTVIYEQGAKLQYPSSTYVKSDKDKAAYVKLERGVILQGELYQCGSANVNNMIQIEDSAKVQGLVYAENRLVLRGKVEGVVVCDRFYLKTPSAIYDNQLLDGRIDRTVLPGTFLFSGLMMDNAHKGFIKRDVEN